LPARTGLAAMDDEQFAQDRGGRGKIDFSCEPEGIM
jgi:hypothetical protein